MTNEEKIFYLNSFFNQGKNFVYCGPKSLFKYRPFDKFAFDMIENEYVYLCPAKNEDDSTECDVSFELRDYYNVKYGGLTKECIDQIIEYLRPYTSSEDYEKARNIVYQTLNKDGLIRPNWIIEASFLLQKLAPGIDIAPLINWLVNIPEKLDDPQISAQIEKLFLIGLNAKTETGICSLCESSNDLDMWKNYAKNETGYCIEYNMEDYEFNVGVFPVIYQKERQTNIVMQILGNFIGQMIFNVSNGQLDADKSQFIRLFLTKDTKWAYQNEWRLLGSANTRMPTPQIKNIYLGRNSSVENREKVLKIAQKMGFRTKYIN